MQTTQTEHITVVKQADRFFINLASSQIAIALFILIKQSRNWCSKNPTGGNSQTLTPRMEDDLEDENLEGPTICPQSKFSPLKVQTNLNR